MQRLDRTIHSQAQHNEGWHRLYQRTLHALTHFMTMRQNATAESLVEQVGEASADYALLPVNVQLFEDGYRVTLELPGMAAEDFDIGLIDAQLLVIRGEKRVPESLVGGQITQLECAYGHFERQIELPGPVDEQRTSANYRQGVLVLDLALAAPRSARRRIQVNVE